MQLYTGCVENRQDPLKLGRCQVRVVGLHNHDKTQLKTEDLPWAYPMQPVTSAAMSGIGHAPVGPVEGTWVVVMFRDDDEQQPIILGSIGGIPQAPGAIDSDEDGMVIKEDGYLPGSFQQTTTTPTGGMVTSGQPTKVEENVALKPASSYKATADAVAVIKAAEGLRLKAYQDTRGIWTVGYGTTSINGFPVDSSTVISSAQAEAYLLDYINNVAAKDVQSRCKALITQSMFDAMCSFAYNLGGPKYGKSTVLSETNASKYLDAATQFTTYNKTLNSKTGQYVVEGGLVKRRDAEKALYLKDGIPNVSGDVTPVQSPTPPVNSTPTSSGQKTADTMSAGFKDPKGKYPLYLNEPDTNKLARHEDIKKTIVRKKELAREKQVETAQGKKWDQAKIPYNAQYPYNHVYMSESGHVMEFDDTEKKERVHLYHKSGTYMEVDANGTKTNRIIGDKFEILERNGYVYIKGSADVTIEGEHNILVKNALNLDVYGKTIINVFNDTVMNVSGIMDLAVKEDLNIRAKNINMETYGGNFNVKSSRHVNVEAAAVQNFKAGATFNVDSVRTDFNNGTAGSATESGLVTPADKKEPVMPEFPELVVLTRGADAAAHYETPEEGDSTAYTNKQIEDGTLDPAEKDSGTAQGTASAGANSVAQLPQSCSLIQGMDKFTADLQLSPHFTLGALTSGGSRMPVSQVGLTPQQIVCNLKGLAENCLEPIINKYPGMHITSGFRRPGDVAKSSATSQHYNGEAADIVIPGFNRQQHYEAIQEIQKLVPYDQLILEYSGSTTVWIHVSFKYSGARKMAFTMRDHQRYGAMGTYTLIT